MLRPLPQKVRGQVLRLEKFELHLQLGLCFLSKVLILFLVNPALADLIKRMCSVKVISIPPFIHSIINLFNLILDLLNKFRDNSLMRSDYLFNILYFIYDTFIDEGILRIKKSFIVSMSLIYFINSDRGLLRTASEVQYQMMEEYWIGSCGGFILDLINIIKYTYIIILRIGMQMEEAQSQESNISRTSSYLLGLGEVKANSLQQDILQLESTKINCNEIKKLVKNSNFIVENLESIFRDVGLQRAYKVVKKINDSYYHMVNFLMESIERKKNQNKSSRFSKVQMVSEQIQEGHKGIPSLPLYGEANLKEKSKMNKMGGVYLYNQNYRRKIDEELKKNSRPKQSEDKKQEDLCERQFKKQLLQKMKKQLSQLEQKIYCPVPDEVMNFVIFEKKFLENFNHFSHAENIEVLANYLQNSHASSLELANKTDLGGQVSKFKVQIELLIKDFKQTNKSRNQCISEKLQEVIRKFLEKKKDLFEKTRNKMEEYRKKIEDREKNQTSIGVETHQKQLQTLKGFEKKTVEIEQKYRGREEQMEKAFKSFVEKCNREKNELENELTQFRVKQKCLVDQIEELKSDLQKVQDLYQQMKSSQKSTRSRKLESGEKIYGRGQDQDQSKSGYVYKQLGHETVEYNMEKESEYESNKKERKLKQKKQRISIIKMLRNQEDGQRNLKRSTVQYDEADEERSQMQRSKCKSKKYVSIKQVDDNNAPLTRKRNEKDKQNEPANDQKERQSEMRKSTAQWKGRNQGRQKIIRSIKSIKGIDSNRGLEKRSQSKIELEKQRKNSIKEDEGVKIIQFKQGIGSDLGKMKEEEKKGTGTGKKFEQKEKLDYLTIKKQSKSLYSIAEGRNEESVKFSRFVSEFGHKNEQANQFVQEIGQEMSVVHAFSICLNNNKLQMFDVNIEAKSENYLTKCKKGKERRKKKIEVGKWLANQEDICRKNRYNSEQLRGFDKLRGLDKKSPHLLLINRELRQLQDIQQSQPKDILDFIIRVKGLLKNCEDLSTKQQLRGNHKIVRQLQLEGLKTRADNKFVHFSLHEKNNSEGLWQRNIPKPSCLKKIRKRKDQIDFTYHKTKLKQENEPIFQFQLPFIKFNSGL